MALVTLLGGPNDGARVDPLGQKYISADSGRLFTGPTLYVANKYASAWPIPGWDLLLLEDVTRGGLHHADGTEALWTTWLYATEERHADIVEAFEPLNRVLNDMEYVRGFKRSSVYDLDGMHDVALERVRHHLRKLLSLTTGGHR